MNLLAVVPTYNEERKIADTVTALKSLALIKDVYIVDDCSVDETVKKAKKAGAHIVKHKKNLGKGHSLNEFFKNRDLSRYDGVLLADGDLGLSAAEFKHLIRAFEKDRLDMVIAAFGKPKRKGGFGLVKGLARWAIKKHGAKEMNAPLSGQRVISRETIKDILPFAKGFGIETDMTIRALKKNYKVREVEVKMTHNETGRDLKGFLHRGRQFKDVLKVIVKNALSLSK